MTAHEELLERLRKATGDDREIDGLLYGLQNGLRRNEGTFQVGDKFQFEHPTARHPTGPAALYILADRVPEYTDSIDAALTLLEGGLEYSISTLYCHAWVEVGLNASEGGSVGVRRADCNVPLAICEAAITFRARCGLAGKP